MFRCSLQVLSETFLILRRTERYIAINVHRSSCEVPVIIVRLIKLDFLDRFFGKKNKCQIWRKSVQWERSFVTRTDIQT